MWRLRSLKGLNPFFHERETEDSSIKKTRSPQVVGYIIKERISRQFLISTNF
jgi:hypothetical protein